MRIDDICSPGFVPNSHRLRQETVRAIAFCETIGSVEKAVELQKYFREAIEYLDREIVSSGLPESEKPIVDVDAVSPFDEEEIVVEPEPQPEPPKPAQKKGKGK